MSTSNRLSPLAWHWLILKRRRFATLVTDLKMRELDGFALLRGAKALRPNVPMILFSGHIDSGFGSRLTVKNF
jgi:DNA-binding NtrC family response regulator